MSNSYSLQVAADFADSEYEENMSIHIFILEEGECQMALENKKLDKEEKTPDLAWLDDPEVFRVGQIKSHSDHHFFDGEETYQKQEESLCQCLNGTWQFAWSKNPAGRPADFYREDADVSGFGTIQVPGHMELAGLTGFTISIPCIHGRVMSIEDRPKPDLESRRGSFLRRSTIRLALIGAFLI